MAFTVDIRGNATHLEKTLGFAKGRIMELGNAAKVGVAGLAALGAAGAAGMGAFVISSSKAAAGMEDLSMQFEVLTKSASVTKDLMQQFRDEAAKSPLSIADYAKAAKTMMAFGMDVKDVMPSLKALGDVSMGNSDRFASLALAFSQTQAAGRLMGQEVLQFVNAGFNPLQEISRKTGESMVTLKKRMEDGAISAKEVSDAFRSATGEGGLFFGAIQRGADTTSGKIAKFKDSIDVLKIAFGTGFNDGFKTALDAANNFLPQLEGKFAKAGEVVGSAISKAVQGNTAELAAVGAFMGEIVFAGFKAVYLKGMDELVAGAQNVAQGFIEQARGLATRGEILSPEQAARNVIEKGNLSESASLSSYLQTAIQEAGQSGSFKTLQNADIQRQIAEGIKTGITNSMSDEVKKGILEAWAKQYRGATFAN